MKRMKCKLVFIALILLLIGCSSQPDYTLVNDEISTMKDTDYMAMPYDELTPGLDIRAIPMKFDVIAKDNSANDFFMGLVDGVGINMIVHPDIKQNITINLKNVTLEETLQAVRDIYGLEYVRTAYGYRILPKELQNKVFHVNYLNVKRKGSSGMSVASGHIGGYETSGTNATSNTGNRNGGVSTASKIETQADTDFWQSLKQSVQVIIGNGKDRRVVVDPQAGLIVVRAYPNELASVDEYLRKAEISLQKQVIIEAKIIEVRLNDAFQAGIKWEALGSSGSTDIVSSLTSSTVRNPDDIEGVLSVAFTGSDFSGAIQLLQRQGEVQVLSSPRISTVNNQKAVIKVGTDEFFVTDVSTNTTTTTTTTNTSPELSLTPFFSGIALDVTPQIGRGDEVILHVHPSVTEVVERNKVIEVGDSTFDLPLAFSSIRETDSIIRSKNGQVVVIGGLLQSSQSRVDASVPWLSKIPLIGALFTQTQRSNAKSELVILLQPKVIHPEHWDNEYEQIEKNFPSWNVQGGTHDES